MTRILIVTVFTWVLLASPAAAQPTGVYLCDGRNSDGTYYREVTLTVTTMDGRIALEWRKGSVIMGKGFGFIDGDSLVAIFAGNPAFGVPDFGVVLYRVSADRLDGRWTTGGPVLPERCGRGPQAEASR